MKLFHKECKLTERKVESLEIINIKFKKIMSVCQNQKRFKHAQNTKTDAYSGSEPFEKQKGLEKLARGRVSRIQK